MIFGDTYRELTQLPEAAGSKFFNRIRRTWAAHQYLQKVRIGENQADIGLNGTCNKPGVLDAQFFTSRSFIVMKHKLYKWHQLPPRPEMLSECLSQRQATPGNTHSCRGISHQNSFLRIESQDCSRTETEVGIGLQ